MSTKHSEHIYLAPIAVIVLNQNSDKVLRIFLEETVQVSERVASKLISVLTTLVFVKPSAY